MSRASPSPDAVRPEDVQGRTAVQRLLPENPTAALAMARKIRHPWYRCQALASVAEVAQPRAQALKLLAESMAAAFEQAEPNRVVSAASWPLKHWVQIDPGGAAIQVERLLAMAATEPHGLRRLDALSFLLGAVAPEAALRSRVTERFIATSARCTGWRTERVVAALAMYLADFDRALAQRLLAMRWPNRFTRKASESLRAREPPGKA